jgi:decaprenylphospho-beta-D-ribofuranose 2-oxidase
MVESRVSRPEKREGLEGHIHGSDGEVGETLLARGAGRSYGDAALLEDGGTTVLTGRMDRMLGFDPTSGVLRAEAGVRLRQ